MENSHTRPHEGTRVVSRRSVLKTALAGAAAALPAAVVAAPKKKRKGRPPVKIDLDQIEKVVVNGRIKQCICGVGLRGVPVETKCEMLVKMGLKGMDFVGPNDWPTLKKHGLVCSLARGAGNIRSGFNRKENHARLVADMRKSIDQASAAGWKNVITFSGNRHLNKDDKEGVSDEEGARNCIEGLKQVVGYAEEKGVTIVMELLNSKRNHPDYQADHTAWGVEVCKGVGSERFKLLYDIYHMQIMEGDIIATIRESAQYIGHYHTAGNPGRNELSENQEIYYPAVMQTILDTGYTGYVSHEYNPKGDPIAALVQAVKACDV